MLDYEIYKQEAIKHRRALHAIPEIGLHEFATQKYIMERLSEYNIPCERVAGSGVLAFFDNGCTETIMLRADIDALPIKEQTNLSFASKNEGFMHACGHDGHCAMLLAAAKCIKDNDSRLSVRANVLILFQPAEEGPGGAKIVVEENVLSRFSVSEIYGLHLSPDYPFGGLFAPRGEFFACGVELYFTIHGRGAHAAQPHKGTDAIVAAAALIMQLQTVVSRTLSPMENAALTIGTIAGGSAQNAIAETVRLSGALRAFDIGVRTRLLDKIAQICSGIEEGFGVAIDNSPIICYPPLKNDASLWDNAQTRLSGKLSSCEAVMLSEDFAYYCEQAKSLFMFLGFRDDSPEHSHPLHSAHFDFDDAVLIEGVKAFIGLITKD